MKKGPAIYRLILLVMLAVLVTVFVAVSGASSRQRHATTCKGLNVVIADSASLSFVNASDIKGYMESYGPFLGQRLDSVNLRRIEEILGSKSAILGSEAYMTDDGMLNIRITQREPVVRFQKGGTGFYADERGFIFPLQENYTSLVPVVDGAVPIYSDASLKGEPATPRERKWLADVTSLLAYISRDKVWSELVAQLTVEEGGDIVIIPREGAERFVFGSPDGFDAKFDRIRNYYQAVKPLHEGDYYTRVNVKFDNQIICRKK